MFQKQKPLPRRIQIIKNLEKVRTTERRIRIEVSSLGRVHVIAPKPIKTDARILAGKAQSSSRFLSHGPWPNPRERRRAWPYPWRRGSERTD